MIASVFQWPCGLMMTGPLTHSPSILTSSNSMHGAPYIVYLSVALKNSAGISYAS